MLLILLAGAGVGIYLVQHPAILKPSASENSSNSNAIAGMTYTHTDFSACDMTTGGTNIGFANTGLVVSYDKAGVRDGVKKRLADMKASGINSLDLVIWFMHDPSGGTWGIIPSANKRVDEPYRTNLANYLQDVKNAGFERIMISMGPQWTNAPANYELGKYDPNLFEENWQFIKDVRSIAKQNGPAGTYFDIAAEGAPPNPAPERKQQMWDYAKQIWTNYVREFGKDDAVISFISPNPIKPDDPIKDNYSDLWDSGAIDNLYDIFESSGQGQPNWYQFSFYPDKPTYERSLHILNYIDQKLTSRGYTGDLIVRETWYDNAEVGRAISEFNKTHNRKIREALAWYLKYYEGYGNPDVDKFHCPVNGPYYLGNFISNLSPASQITAYPNPCIISEGQTKCTSTVYWSAKNPQGTVQVKVRETGGLFAQAPYGSQNAPWVNQTPVNMDLYDGGTLLGSVSIKGTPQSGQTSQNISQNSSPVSNTGILSASPNPCKLSDSGKCTATISWKSDYSDLKITIRENPGSLFARAPYGALDATWITASGATFDAYSGSTLVDSLFVRGIATKPDGRECTSTLRNDVLTDSCPKGYSCDNSGGSACTDDYPSSFCSSSGFCRPSDSIENRTINSEGIFDQAEGINIPPPYLPNSELAQPYGFPVPSGSPASPETATSINSSSSTPRMSISCRVGQINRVIGSLLGCADQ